jgi:hypothetical protein
MIKWIQQHWHEVIDHMNSLWFVVTAAIGSLVGLQAEENLSFRKAFVVFITSYTTTIAIVLLLDYYYNPGNIVLVSVSYFMGLVGRKVTMAFIDFVKRLITQPRQTLKSVSDIITLLKSLK